ncbi:sortase B protein-sorting domain-containing protein [Sessilibacter sp. MAH4]
MNQTSDKSSIFLFAVLNPESCAFELCF